MNRLIELGYDGADVHYIHKFFRVGSILIRNPGDKDYDASIISMKEDRLKLDTFTSKASKHYLDQAIEFGRLGMDYTMVKFEILNNE